ncbi:MAG: MmgE/PrpD family protein, partial [Deltaproteobacteria bacterium]|nr:MmgE/PrpD family protein [Deltaproteobacteria bacterium]
MNETMAETVSLTQQLAQQACSLTYEDLSGHQVQKIKTHFLDWLGTVYVGQTQTPIQIMLEVIEHLQGQAESTIIPNGSRTIGLLAAWVNSASSCLLEMDDLHRESIFHPASVVIPAALAVAEREHVSGRDLLAAIAAGYELGIRVALGAGLTHYRYWH